MRIKQLLVILLSAINIHAYAQWTEDMYSRYTYANYTDYDAFNQSIAQTGYDAHLLEAAIFYETNRQRAEYGLPLLEFDYNLFVCAHNHSVDMVNYDFYAHESPVSGKQSMSDRLDQVGYTNCTAAENIAEIYIRTTYVASAQHLVNLWMNSPGHRTNILNSKLTHLGCGVAYLVINNTVYVRTTQNFIRKK